VGAPRAGPRRRLTLLAALALLAWVLVPASAEQASATATVSVSIPEVVFGACVRLTPRTVNRASARPGKTPPPITGHLQFPDPSLLHYLKQDSLRLNGRVVPYQVVSCGDGQLVVKFSRNEALATVPNGDRVRFVVTGILGAGYQFTGEDYLRVID